MKQIVLLQKSVRILSAILGAIFLIETSAQSAFAQNRVQISVPFTGQPSTAVGIIFADDGARQIVETSVVRRDPQNLVVSFNFSSDDVSSGTFASALVHGDDGTSAFGNTVALNTEFPDNAYVEIPECVENQDIPQIGEEQLGSLQKLVDVRIQRRHVLQTKITRLMQGAALEKLRKLEKGFGLGDAAELAPDMHPLQLIDRLTRLKLAIASYETLKKK